MLMISLSTKEANCLFAFCFWDSKDSYHNLDLCQLLLCKMNTAAVSRYEELCILQKNKRTMISLIQENTSEIDRTQTNGKLQGADPRKLHLKSSRANCGLLQFNEKKLRGQSSQLIKHLNPWIQTHHLVLQKLCSPTVRLYFIRLRVS